jgi:hypothetical protein
VGIVTPSVFLEDQGNEYQGEVVFSLSGGEAMEITVEMLDSWSGENGQRISLPPGSTPLSGANRLALGSHATRYLPNGSVQKVSIPLRIGAESVREVPLLAAIRITLNDINAKPDEEKITIISSALAFVYAAPDEASLMAAGYSANVDVTRLLVTALKKDMTPESSNALTFVEGHPVAVAFESANTGSLFGFVTHTLTIGKKTWPWITRDDPEAAVFKHLFAEVILIPGQTRWDYVPVTGQISGSTQEVNLLTDWGIYDITLLTDVHSGSGIPTQSVSTVTFVVFPLRMTLGVLLVISLGLFAAFRLGSGARRQTVSQSTALEKPN